MKNTLILNFKKLIFENLNKYKITILASNNLLSIFDFYFNQQKKDAGLFKINAIYNKANKNIKWLIILCLSFIKNYKNNSHGIIICVNVTNIFFLYCIRKIFQNAIIINRFVDEFYEIKNFKNKQKILKTCQKLNIIIETYSKSCALQYNIIYSPNFINSDILIHKLKTITPKKQCFFVGLCSNERIDILLKIADILLKNNYPILFYLTHVNEEMQKKINEINQKYYGEYLITNKFLKYDQYIDKLLESSIIIDVFRCKSDEGYSFRIAECLLSNKKLITNRQIIKNEKFYDKNNILILEKNTSEKEITDFINSKKSIAYSNIEDFDFNSYLDKYLDKNYYDRKF